jgi:hypothetical protein
MATIQVRFRFICQSGDVTFDRLHNIPSSLVNMANGDPTEQYHQLWFDTTCHIIGENEADCLAHSLRTCACGSPAVAVEVPMPFFDRRQRRAVVLVDPICGQERCRTRLQQETRHVASHFRWSIDGKPVDTDPYVFRMLLRIKECATVDGVKRCGRCKSVVYCGNAHERHVCAVHKPGCVPPYKMDENLAASATSDAVRPKSTSSQDTGGFEEIDNDDGTVYEWTYSGFFKADDGVSYGLSKEDVLAYLMSGNVDE